MITVSAECDHPIYCKGKILEKIQMERVFVDSKTFVDMPLKFNSSYILDKFASLPTNPSLDTLKMFLNEHFSEAGSDVKKVDPVDWNDVPSVFESSKTPQILDSTLREWGIKIHQKWKELVRTFERNENCGPECYSHIQVPHPFVVAGGRFREYYYWDSYWILEGLLVSEMYETAKGMIENFLHMVDTYGFMPNGGRIYYLNRSQPPMLTLMVYEYFEKTHDIEFLRRAVPTLEKEYMYFMTKKSVTISKGDKHFLMNRYNVNVTRPRPEAYKEDIATAQKALDEKFTTSKEATYSHLASGAESGWDYSSRWFHNHDELHTIVTRDIVPVDLNSIMYKIENSLSYFHSVLGDNTKQSKYLLASLQRKKAIESILWDSDKNMWWDYDYKRKTWNKTFYPSNFLPIWSKASHLSDNHTTMLIMQNLDYFTDVGGVMTSTIHNHEQWDSHNAWPPLQAFIIESFAKVNHPSIINMARDITNRWVTSNYCAWNATFVDFGGVMFEKYNAKIIGMPGDGGEYQVQEGFGWTNGVILKLLKSYGNSLSIGKCTLPSNVIIN